MNICVFPVHILIADYSDYSFKWWRIRFYLDTSAIEYGRDVWLLKNIVIVIDVWWSR